MVNKNSLTGDRIIMSTANQLNIISRTTRASNMELVRIVAMSLILVYHFLNYAITPQSLPKGVFGFLYPFFSCGVNLFFLLSGWFQIRLSKRNFVRLVITIFLFNVVNVLMCIAAGKTIVLSLIIKQAIFPISQSYYWFIAVYLGLLLTSPLLNSGLHSMNIISLRKFILIFSLFTFLSCAIGHNQCNMNGYTYVQSVYLYCLAYWLHKDDILYRKINQTMCLTGYVVILMLCGLWYSRWQGALNYINYNSLPIVTSSALIFIFFTRLKFHSRIVNYLGGVALGCYLLQDGLFGHQFMYEWMHTLYTENPIGMSLVIFCSVFAGTWIVSMIVSKITSLISNTVADAIHASHK